MSDQPSRSRFSASASYSFSSSSINGSTTSRTEATYMDPNGVKVYRKSQNPGEAPREERIEYDSSGRSLQNAGPAVGAIEDRIQDVTEVDDEAERQSKRDRLYEQRMEDEYAKREGGS